MHAKHFKQRGGWQPHTIPGVILLDYLEAHHLFKNVSSPHGGRGEFGKNNRQKAQILSSHEFSCVLCIPNLKAVFQNRNIIEPSAMFCCSKHGFYNDDESSFCAPSYGANVLNTKEEKVLFHWSVWRKKHSPIAVNGLNFGWVVPGILGAGVHLGNGTFCLLPFPFLSKLQNPALFEFRDEWQLLDA